VSTEKMKIVGVNYDASLAVNNQSLSPLIERPTSNNSCQLSRWGKWRLTVHKR
jgi:hypothetical protein